MNKNNTIKIRMYFYCTEKAIQRLNIKFEVWQNNNDIATVCVFGINLVQWSKKSMETKNLKYFIYYG